MCHQFVIWNWICNVKTTVGHHCWIQFVQTSRVGFNDPPSQEWTADKTVLTVDSAEEELAQQSFSTDTQTAVIRSSVAGVLPASCKRHSRWLRHSGQLQDYFWLGRISWPVCAVSLIKAVWFLSWSSQSAFNWVCAGETTTSLNIFFRSESRDDIRLYNMLLTFLILFCLHSVRALIRYVCAC